MTGETTHDGPLTRPDPPAPRGPGLTARLSRALGTATVPLAVAGNIGAYLIALSVLDAVRPLHTAQADAWRFVTVLSLISFQAFWLIWARRLPVSAFFAAVILWQLAIIVGGYDGLLLQPGVLLAVFTYASERTGRGVWIALTAGCLLTVTGLLTSHALHAPAGAATWDDPAVLTAWALTGSAAVLLPAAAGRWYAQLRDRAERIAELAHRATTGEAERIAEAVAAERRMLAQEIHDTSSAHLTAILAFTAALQRGGGHDEAQQRVLRKIADEGGALFAGYERMLNGLRTEDRTSTGRFQPGHRSGQHHVVELSALVDEMRRTTGMSVTFRHDPTLDEMDRRLGPMRSHTAFRVVQEALNNARKHSPGAAVRVGLEDDGTSLLLRVENDSPPAVTEDDDPDRPDGRSVTLSLGYGLEGLRDRLTTVGGSLRVGPRQNGGWSVTALLPHPPVRGARPARAGVADDEPGDDEDGDGEDGGLPRPRLEGART
ncbi:ATP-binding protein [Microbacterium album]|uniref:histidine kinase n=1 Tax=Microbacterium album TaxID=2053191 RepID=A0A917IIH3_9MICO|nr:ATP-binding protein [Microbacterium album]GGH51144.1 hypothetical protein GCM10010921_30380 [Microbacterium album]